ncbi:MAG: GxxExxY protein [Bradymonadaceae bacterium]
MTDRDDISGEVIGAAVDVHRELGPGLLESAYESCLAYELGEQRIPYERQTALPVRYKDVRLDCGYRIDFLVRKTVLVELKCISEVRPIHRAQVLSYLRQSQAELGLLLNFHERTLIDGVTRLIDDEMAA